MHHKSEVLMCALTMTVVRGLSLSLSLSLSSEHVLHRSRSRSLLDLQHVRCTQRNRATHTQKWDLEGIYADTTQMR